MTPSVAAVNPCVAIWYLSRTVWIWTVMPFSSSICSMLRVVRFARFWAAASKPFWACLFMMLGRYCW